MDRPWEHTARALAVGAVAWAGGSAFFFGPTLFSSFDVLLGDRGDTRLITYLHEHLFQALIGNAEFLSPGFYFPQRGVLGYSDAFLLDLPLYALFRAFGLDPFVSAQVLFILLSGLCFMASLAICLRYLQVRPTIALCAAVLVTFPNNLMFKTAIGHPQFFGTYYLPFIVLLALWGLERFPQTDFRSHARIAVAAALTGLLFSTTYYVAWMFCLTLLMALSAVAMIWRSEFAVFVRNHTKPLCLLGATAIIAFAIALIPFAIIYLPARLAFPSRGYREYLAFAPTLPDLFNVSSWNLLWGWLVDFLRLQGGDAERTLMVTPGLIAIFLAFAWRSRASGGAAWQRVFVTACIAVLALSTLIMVKIGILSAYWFVYSAVPGSSGIRAGGRIQLIANMWVVFGIAVLLEGWLRAAREAERGRRYLLAGALLLFCMIEQVNRFPLGALTRSRELAWLSQTPTPPADCQAFLVSVPNPQPDFVDHHDAMWISWKVGLPTLNGASGWWPLGWTLQDRGGAYLQAARDWVARTGLKGQVCLYDRTERQWSPFQ